MDPKIRRFAIVFSTITLLLLVSIVFAVKTQASPTDQITFDVDRPAEEKSFEATDYIANGFRLYLLHIDIPMGQDRVCIVWVGTDGTTPLNTANCG